MSSYTSKGFKQDMPPPGGYEEINYRRIPIQRILGYKSFFAASIVLALYGTYYYRNRYAYMRRLKADYLDHIVAVEPLVLAESDRSFLRHLRHNRNVERDLMKNVPDWEVGTLWGAKLYKTLPEDSIPNISVREFYAHRPIKEACEFTRPNLEVGLEDNDNSPQF